MAGGLGCSRILVWVRENCVKTQFLDVIESMSMRSDNISKVKNRTVNQWSGADMLLYIISQKFFYVEIIWHEPLDKNQTLRTRVTNQPKSLLYLHDCYKTV